MLVMSAVEVKYCHVILALSEISLEVPEGKIVALLGANGAGKSTALKAISGLLETEEGRVTNGSIYFNGIKIDRMSPEDIVRLGIVQVMEGREVIDHLSTEQNLRSGAYLRHGDIKRDLDIVYNYLPRLKELRRAPAGYLSGGEQQMLVVGRAMMARPKLMLLDEPSMGLSPQMIKEILDILQRFNSEEKTAMLIVEQNVSAALSIAEHGYVMENGRLVLDAPAAKLADNPDVKEFYLGLSKEGGRRSYREAKHYRRRKKWEA
jgi:branched-chain amino acid transport system ATP-binding protein